MKNKQTKLLLTVVILLFFSGFAPVAQGGQPLASVIGGAFSLTDHNGKTVSDTDLRGKVMLVFFGYTHCPDICPVTVTTLSKAMEMLGKDADQVVPVFITVDPARDTPKAMKDYLANFDKRMIGLTGDAKKIKETVAAYKAYAETPAKEEHPHDMHHGAPDYLVNHSGIVYLMGKDGQYVRHFSYDAPVKEIADGVRAYLSGKN